MRFRQKAFLGEEDINQMYEDHQEEHELASEYGNNNREEKFLLSKNMKEGHTNVARDHMKTDGTFRIGVN